MTDITPAPYKRDAIGVQDQSILPGLAFEPVAPINPVGTLDGLDQSGNEFSRQSILKSRMDNLDRWKLVWMFRRVWLYSFMIYMLNSIDGWQVGPRERFQVLISQISVAGAIIVNKGFIEQ